MNTVIPDVAVYCDTILCPGNCDRCYTNFEAKEQKEDKAS